MPTDNYSISWYNESWFSFLNENTALDYFCQPSNPFYENICNNETIRMQRLDMRMLSELTGVEYILAWYFDPNLFVIRKQYRLSTEETKSLCLFYVVKGMIYQCPDVGSWLNSRISSISSGLLNTLDRASKNISYSFGEEGFKWISKDVDGFSEINARNSSQLDATLDNSVGEFIMNNSDSSQTNLNPK